MKIKLTLLLIFFSFFGLMVFQNCAGGGGGGDAGAGAGGGGTTATINVLQAPIVVAKNTDGTSGEVNVGAAISVIFSTAMDSSTITTSTFTISGIGGVSGTVAYNSGTKTASFTPSSSLAYGTTYTATITTGVKDTAGNAILNNFTWNFTTQQSAPAPLGTPTLMGGAIQGNPLNPVPTIVTHFVGSTGSQNSAEDGIGTAARFNMPRGITTDGTNLYVADTDNQTIRKIVIATGAVTTFAGSAGFIGATDGIGAAARFYRPFDITSDGTNLYVADSNYAIIRKIVIATGAVTTIAGTAGVYGSTDDIGAAARFNFPTGITTDGTNVYVADTNNNTIRKIVISTGAVTTLAGSAGITGLSDGIGTAARFNSPASITTDGTNLYVVDTNNASIRKIVISTGAVTTLAGSLGLRGVTTDGTNLYITSESTIRKIVIATGVVTTIVGTGFLSVPYGVATDGTNLFVVDWARHAVSKISPLTSAPSSSPIGLTVNTGDAQAIFSWSNVAGATSYNLYCASGTSVTTTTGTKIANIASPYYLGHYWTATPIEIINGSNYACIVTAVNSFGESVASSVVTITPYATYLLSVSVAGTVNGSGTVTSSPSGISCGSICAATVTNGGAVTLTATPASGSTFTGWSGACSGTGACTLTMSSDKTAIANFLGTATPPPPSGGSYYWLNWSCSSTQCQSVMGGASGSVGNFCTLSDCNACNAIGCIGIFGGTCSLTATSTQRVATPANGVCLRSGVDF